MRHGYSVQADFAAALGVDASTIYRWESGDTAVPLERLRDIAALIGKPLATVIIPGPS